MRERWSLLLVLLGWIATTTTTTASATKSTTFTNIQGDALQACGDDQYNYCMGDDDEDASTICIDLTSVVGDAFCEVEECDYESGYACVTPDEFEDYLDKEGGCFAISRIVCEAIHYNALVLYDSERQKHEDALLCLVDRCNLYGSYTTNLSLSEIGIRNELVNIAGFAAVLAGVLMAAVYFAKSMSWEPPFEEEWKRSLRSWFKTSWKSDRTEDSSIVQSSLNEQVDDEDEEEDHYVQQEPQEEDEEKEPSTEPTTDLRLQLARRSLSEMLLVAAEFAKSLREVTGEEPPEAESDKKKAFMAWFETSLLGGQRLESEPSGTTDSEKKPVWSWFRSSSNQAAATETLRQDAEPNEEDEAARYKEAPKEEDQQHQNQVQAHAPSTSPSAPDPKDAC